MTSRRVSEAAMWHATQSETAPRAYGRCSSGEHQRAAWLLPIAAAGAAQQLGVAGAGGTGARREPQVIEERPAGLAGGKYSWPAWAIGVVGGALVLIALAVWLLRVQRSRKQ